MTSPEQASCPECGASEVAGMSCWDQLGHVLAWEGDDPALQAVHFLTVATYNLQHPARFADNALAGLRELFVERLDRGTPITEIRRRVGRAAAGRTRVVRPSPERRPVLRSWNVTIDSVYQLGQPRGAAERVRAWAASVRAGIE